MGIQINKGAFYSLSLVGNKGIVNICYDVGKTSPLSMNSLNNFF